MSPAVIQEQEVQALGKRVGTRLNEDLEDIGMQGGPFQTEALTAGGRYRAIDVAPLADVLDWTDRRHATRGEAPATDGQQAEAAFVWAEHPDGASGMACCRRSRPLAWKVGSASGVFGVAGPGHFALGRETGTHARVERLVLNLHPMRPPYPLT
jgi:hypothetical protein